jgi:hypothetical protein
MKYLALALVLFSSSLARADFPWEQKTEARAESLGVTEDTGTRVMQIEVLPVATGAQVGFAVGDRVTVGPQASSVSFLGDIMSNSFFSDEYHYSGFSYGVQAKVRLSGSNFADGWVLNPYIGRINYNVTTQSHDFIYPAGTLFNDDVHATYYGALLGYEWVWDRGFSFTVGGGFTAYTSSRSQSLTAPGKQEFRNVAFGGVNPALLLGFGYIL